MIVKEIDIFKLLVCSSKVNNKYIIYVSYNGIGRYNNPDEPYENVVKHIAEITKNIPEVTIKTLPIAQYLYFNNSCYIEFDDKKEAREFFDKIECDANDYGIYACLISPIEGVVTENT